MNNPIVVENTIVASSPSTDASNPWPRHTVFRADASAPDPTSASRSLGKAFIELESSKVGESTYVVVKLVRGEESVDSVCAMSREKAWRTAIEGAGIAAPSLSSVVFGARYAARRALGGW